jgi:cytochrome c biogenesis protein CcdA
MTALVYSSSLIAAFIGGFLALLAPCCVVAVLPTFVAATLPHRGLRLLQNTLLFAAGVAVVLLPITLGLGAISHWVARLHTVLFLVVGLFLLGLGAYVLSGRGFMVPLSIGSRRIDPQRPGGMFLLGIASGVTSSCCAPVLAGVAALSAMAPSFGGVIALSSAYVFGMVLPLLVATLVWHRAQPTVERWLGGRPARLSWGRWSLPWTDALAGGLFVVMGGLAVVLALSGRGTFTPGWLYRFNTAAANLGGAVVHTLGGVPGSVQALALIGLGAGVALLWIRGWRRDRREPPRSSRP